MHGHKGIVSLDPEEVEHFNREYARLKRSRPALQKFLAEKGTGLFEMVLRIMLVENVADPLTAAQRMVDRLRMGELTAAAQRREREMDAG